MPVRSLNSSVLKWPDQHTVIDSLKRWVEKIIRKRKDILNIGYFGSYARGDWGVGSDLDMIIILQSSQQSFERRGAEWDTTELPVPTDVLVYTKEEWELMKGRKSSYISATNKIIWLYSQDKNYLKENF